MKTNGWQTHLNEAGDFELATYLYSVINNLMKLSLDMGTLLSDDRNKLRAYKEQVKSSFKGQWLEVAEALEAFELISPCGCSNNEYCTKCGGSRYRLNGFLAPNMLRETAFFSSEDKPELQEKLRQGLEKALDELDMIHDI